MREGQISLWQYSFLWRASLCYRECSGSISVWSLFSPLLWNTKGFFSDCLYDSLLGLMDTKRTKVLGSLKLDPWEFLIVKLVHTQTLAVYQKYQWLLLREIDLGFNSFCLTVFLDFGLVALPVISILSGSKESNSFSVCSVFFLLWEW